MSGQRVWFLAVILGVATAALPGVQAQQTGPGSVALGTRPAATERRSLEIPPGTVVVPGTTPDLLFLYTGDVIGYVDPCG
jgi:hypothetical protein